MTVVRVTHHTQLGWEFVFLPDPLKNVTHLPISINNLKCEKWSQYPFF